MEIFDIVDEEGKPTGRTVERTVAHAQGIRHRTAHIWVVRKRNGHYEFLLQKRSLEKDSFPGQFDTSSAGHIHAGDEPLVSALRELEEELGIQAKPEDLQSAGKFTVDVDGFFHGKVFLDREVAFVYVYDKEVDITKLHLQKEEVDEVQWFDAEKTYLAVLSHDERFCIPRGGIETAGRYLGLFG